jgi:hypothetical protein
MAKHTSGPWVFVGECEPLHCEDGSQFQIWEALQQGGRTIAAVVSNEDQSIGVTEGIANAKLLAAAPELLEALESFLRCPCIGSDGMGSTTLVAQDFNLMAARAAIAKATH